MAEDATYEPTCDDEAEASDEFDVEESHARHQLRNGVVADDVEGHHRQFHCPGLLGPRDFRSSPPVYCANGEKLNGGGSPSRGNGASLSLSSSPPVMMSSTPPGCSDFGHLHASRRRFNAVLSGSLARQLTPDHHVHPLPGSTGSVPTIPCHRLRVSRDATQPSTGSLRSLRSASNDGSSVDEDEETDEFPNKRWSVASYAVSGPSGGGGAATGNNGPLHRPRASTCPETKAFRRRALARAMNRPPTPTPSDDALDQVNGVAADELPPAVLPEDECCGKPVNGQHSHHHHHRFHHHPLQRQNEVEQVVADRLSSLSSSSSSSADVVDNCCRKLSELGFCERSLATCSLTSTAASGNCCSGSSDMLPVITEST